MSKIIFLIPPSEGKNPDGKLLSEKLTFYFEKPREIAKNATEKDLKCSGNRFREAIFLNENISQSVVLPAILRYNGVMFSAFDYENFSKKGKNFFDENFYIISGFYGILKPKDLIGNYKLPASTKGLYNFWGEKILQKILGEKPDYIVNLLSGEYEKFFKFQKNEKIFSENNIYIVNVHFIKSDGKKISHGVKPIKGRFIKEIVENPEDFFQKIFYIHKENFGKNILEMKVVIS